MQPSGMEIRPWTEQWALDDLAFHTQLEYLLARSAFYKTKLRGHDAAKLGLPHIHELPFTEKGELRASCTAENPIGGHLCATRGEIARVFSTSGTTGTPSYIPLTAQDYENWQVTSMRTYATAGVQKGGGVVSTYNAGPFAAGAALPALDRLEAFHIPVGTGNTERLVAAIRLLKPKAAVLTPSYATYLAEWCAERGFDLAASSVANVIVGGEPGGAEPALRTRLEAAWGAEVREIMGIGDIGVSLWGECQHQCGMHFGGQGFVYPELIDPATGANVTMEDGARGELVLTHLMHQAAPLLRFRTRDHVEVWTSPCKCGRTTPRVRCIGRTDDMLIVRGVNVFPSAIREVVAEFMPRVSGHIVVRPAQAGVKQEPPLPIVVELGKDQSADHALAGDIMAKLRNVLVFTPAIELVPFGSLARSEYKSKLVQHQVVHE